MAKPDPMVAALHGTTQVVIDACLAFDAIAGEATRRAKAARFLAVCHSLRVRLIVPPVFAGEVDTTARQTVHRGALAAASLPAVYAALDALPLDTILNAAELDAARVRARDIAAMLQQPSVYDATYAALAEAHGCHFWTADKTFANAAKQVRRQPDGTTAAALPGVRFVGDY
jgi:predicted nucleic acid-binding protein